jgi:hypothetical protein
MNWKIVISTIACYALFLGLYFIALGGEATNFGWIVVTQDVILLIYAALVVLSFRQQRRSHTLAIQDNKIIIGACLLYLLTPIIIYGAFSNSPALIGLLITTLCFLAYGVILLAYASYMINKIKKGGVTQNEKTPVKSPSVKRTKILYLLSGCLGIAAIILPANMSGDEGAWLWGLYYPGLHTFWDFLWNYSFVDQTTWIFVFILLLSAAIVGSVFAILASFQSEKLRRLRPEKTGPIITIGTWIAYLIIALTANFDGVIFGWAPIPVGSMVGLVAGILVLLPL